jgi:hypothetical protein
MVQRRMPELLQQSGLPMGFPAVGKKKNYEVIFGKSFSRSLNKSSRCAVVNWCNERDTRRTGHFNGRSSRPQASHETVLPV